MQITREYLLDRKAEMQAVITLHKGAIDMIDHLLGVLDQDVPEGLPIGEFAEAIAGPGASASIIPIEDLDAV